VGDDQQRLTVFDNRAMGTAMYMSPEQWKTSTVDIRADIYSLGCTLYHLLAGKPPFWESDLKPEKAHEREQLPPIAAGEPLPKGLWEILRRMNAKNPAERFADPLELAAALAPFAQGNHLADLVKVTIGGGTSPRTHPLARTDTRLVKSAESDTRTRTKTSWMGARPLKPETRRRLSRISMGLITPVAVAAIGWLAWQATARRESVNEALMARQHTLQVAAKFAASEIVKEIALRFDTLKRVAEDEGLRKQMLEIQRRPTDTTLWDKLENWLGAQKSDYDAKVTSDSWFINDVRGVQVARSPRSEASRGENYAHRDYFHGQGVDLATDVKNLKPIAEPHLSAVYRSTSTGHLKVAFSVPIENGLKGKSRAIVGVLAMTVDLGEFNVLQNDLPDGLEVALVDLREAKIEDQVRRGLVLHHQDEASYREGQVPPWIGSELLARIEKLLTAATRGKDGGGSVMLPDYRDPALTNDQLYWGAMQPVIDRRPDEPERDLRWLVIVQEPVEGTKAAPKKSEKVTRSATKSTCKSLRRTSRRLE
jgi:hypothetical protein